jgi:hypothetical protein
MNNLGKQNSLNPAILLVFLGFLLLLIVDYIADVWTRIVQPNKSRAIVDG